jgi:hypothetical protein
MKASQAWVCPGCKTIVWTPFCGSCGERCIASRELTLRGVFERVLHALTSVDARVMRSLWLLLRRPGSLSLAYLQGLRKPYASPIALFLLANVLFFAVQSATGINIFGSSLDSHLNHQDWSALAQALVERHLRESHLSLEQYAPLFDAANVLHAKSLVILMVLPFTAVLALAFLRARRPALLHLVFALHLYAFLLLVFTLAVGVAYMDKLFGGAGLESARVDLALSLANVAACATYVYAAIGPVYSPRRFSRLPMALLLTLAAAAIVLGYRFVLLLITLQLS